MEESKSRVENARAIKICLDYLAKEAREARLYEVARLIDVAALAAEDVSEVMH